MTNPDTPDQVKVEQRREEARKIVADHYGYEVIENVSDRCAEVEFVLKGMDASLTPPVANSTGLREALEPFARAAEHFTSNVHYGGIEQVRAAPHPEDFLRAKSALANQSDSTEPEDDWEGPCPICKGRTFAVVDEPAPGGGFQPGLKRRCVNCKSVIDLAIYKSDSTGESRVLTFDQMVPTAARGTGEKAVAGSPVDQVREEAAAGLRHVADALREVHTLGRDGVNDAAFDASMLGQIAACERGASLLSTPATPTAPGVDGLREVARLLELNDTAERPDDDALEMPLGLLRRLAALQSPATAPDRVGLRAAIWNTLGHDQKLGKALTLYGMVRFNETVDALIDAALSDTPAVSRDHLGERG